MNKTSEPNSKSDGAVDTPAMTRSGRGPFTKTAILAMVAGIVCTAFAIQSLALQTWLVWYELFIALIGGYVCVVATCVCAIRSRFSFNRSLATSVVGLLIASSGLYFFHVAYTPDLFFHFSESDIQSSEIILVCDVDRGDQPPKYRIADVLRNRTQIGFEPQAIVANFDPAMDAFLSQSGTGDQIIFFADLDPQSRIITITRHQQVFGGRITGFEDTRLEHLCDLKAFQEFTATQDRSQITNR